MDTDNGFEIHNCVYCDLEDVTTFIRANGSKVRKFETEHVLDKGACPLVALSLYNFIPSCKTCNGPDIKGAKTLGDTIAEMVELSPSAEGYDFDRKVSFEVKILTPGAADLNMATHPDDCEIDFNIRDNMPRYKLFFPKFANKPLHCVLRDDADLMLYNGVAFVSDDLEKLQVLKSILDSNLFWNYLIKNAKPYSTGYYSLSGVDIKNFCIPIP